MINRTLRKPNESAADQRSRIYNQERLKEEASIGLDELIQTDPTVQSRSAYAELLGKSKPFVTKILNAHNFTLETLSDAYFALGYIIHLTLVPRDAGKLRLPVIENTMDISSETVEFVDFRYQHTNAQPRIFSSFKGSGASSRGEGDWGAALLNDVPP